MIVATAMLIFLLLVFMPIHFEVSGRYLFADVKLQTKIKVYGLLLAEEQLFVSYQGIGYQGTVDGYLQPSDDAKQDGIDFTKGITLHSILLIFRSDMANLKIGWFAFQNVMLSIVSQIVCSFCQTQFACVCNNFSNVDDVRFKVKASISLAELSFCFIKQGVRKCIHKLQR